MKASTRAVADPARLQEVLLVACSALGQAVCVGAQCGLGVAADSCAGLCAGKRAHRGVHMPPLMRQRASGRPSAPAPPPLQSQPDSTINESSHVSTYVAFVKTAPQTRVTDEADSIHGRPAADSTPQSRKQLMSTALARGQQLQSQTRADSSQLPHVRRPQRLLPR